MNKQIHGKLLTCTGGLYTAETAQGLVNCYAKGGFRHDGISPVPGDQVSLRLETLGEKEQAYITEISPRKNFLLRPPVANLDRIFVVSSVCQPEPSLLNIDKICSVCVHNKIETILIFSKCDLAPERAQELQRIYEDAGFLVFCFSKDDPETIRSLLFPYVSGVTSAFTGASGVGKSTIMNILFPFLQLMTGEISRKIARGKNTTRQSIFYNLSKETGVENSYLADTPGFSQLDFQRYHFFEKEDLVYTFPEFDSYIGTCRYTKCTHLREEGCQVLKALEKGLISPSRHENYCRLYQDLASYKKWK